jgi:hypothetical protein
VVFVRLQHADGSFESSSQQNSAPGQAIIGSHADGNTAARLAQAVCFFKWVDIPVLQTFPHSVLFPDWLSAFVFLGLKVLGCGLTG